MQIKIKKYNIKIIDDNFIILYCLLINRIYYDILSLDIKYDEYYIFINSYTYINIIKLAKDLINNVNYILVVDERVEDYELIYGENNKIVKYLQLRQRQKKIKKINLNK